MATLELDPVFVKALKLLHSKSKDSTEQLKQMLDDVIAQRRGQTKSSDENEKASFKGSVEKSISKDEDTSKRRETVDKRSFDKLKQDAPELPEAPVKKARFESPQTEKETPQTKEKHAEKEKDKEKEKEQDSRDKEKKKEKEAKEREKKEAAKKEEREKEREKERELKERAIEKQQQKQQQKEKEKKVENTAEESTDEDGVEDGEKAEGDLDKSMDADDFAVGLGIACVVCKQFDVTSTNQLVECQECHSLYHQECHKPPVIEQDVNDPRFVWYCSRCEKSLKKMVSKVQKPKVSPVVSAPPEKPVPVPRPAKPEGTSLFTFRREPKVSSVKEITGHTAAKPLSGLASLAANLSGQSKASSKVDPAKPAPAKPDLSKHGGLLTKSDQPDKPPTLTTSQSRERLKSLDITATGGNSSSSGNNNNNNNSNSSKHISKASSDPQKSVSRSSLSESPKSGAVFTKVSVETAVNKSLLKQASTSKSSQGGASSVANADKRLQLMKKKAAAKLQEKRSSAK
ncbi:hypothetical protein CHS0354_011524 [Potamilus streckersoni]|uniref:Integrator complex subunit 12 n=1 Tax=Potamilus streckersoni TaxID=2493646 RepID=A0AAE0SL49_9BIVA|nr:hypothetical protein CHS0354_011524 [Potamilus streckersoni]